MSASDGRPWAVFAGGGTGGHLYPALAVARELVARGHDPSTLHFIGARNGIEAKTGALQEFPSTLLPGRGWRRRFSAADMLANGRALAGETIALTAAMRLFAGWRPAVVVSLGGYAALPAVVAAVTWRSPVVAVTVDAVPGLVNRWAARFAAVTALGVPGAALPRSVVTGVPVRPSMASVRRSEHARAEARRRLGLPEAARVVAISGGSLGSRRINEAASELARLWSGRPDIAIYHVVGQRDWADFGTGPESAPGPQSKYRRVPYEEDMATLYEAADVAVQRAGASTVAELALAGLPSVLVPLPRAPGDHQGANARALAGAGAAVLVPDGELDGQRLAKELSALLDDPRRLAAMGEAAASKAHPGAAAAVADLVEGHARPSPPPSRAGKRQV